jgi:nucleotide-binding universal stress UspA family protein
MFRRALICTDLRDGLSRLLAHLDDLALGGFEAVAFLHCLPTRPGDVGIPQPDRGQLEAAQRQLALPAQIPQGLTAQTWVRQGALVEEAARIAQEFKPDLLIVAAPTRDLLTEALFGSHSRALLERLCLPLLTLRPQLLATYTREEVALRCQHLFRHLLVPYNGGPPARRVLNEIHVRQLERIADQQVEHLTLLGVVRPTNYYPREGQESAMAGVLQIAQEVLSDLPMRVESVLRIGTPRQEVIQLAIAQDISAIALSSRQVNKLIDWSRNDAGNELLRRSWFPVLYFPPGRGDQSPATGA